MLKKNEEYIVDILDNGFEGEGIARIDNAVIFIPGAIKGEKAKIKILKVNSRVSYGKIIDVLEKSEFRKDSDCGTYPRCGGCNLRHIDYDKTVEIKKTGVESTLKKALHREIKVNEVIKMDEPFYYRNKLQYPIGFDKNGEMCMGVYAERSHTIIPTRDCKIQNKLCQNIANDLFDFAKLNGISAYNEETREGILRHFVIRFGRKTNEVMVTIVVNNLKIPKEEEMVKYITEKYPEIKTIVKNLNNKNTNVILGLECKTIFGDGYIYDFLGNKKFKISPLSFYQVNPIQTEKLYSKAVEFAELTGDETIFDLYCGIGTIGIFASDKVKKIYGIETIPEAIEDAKQNAKLNNIENAEFFVGDVEVALPKFLQENNIKPDCIFIDPPRKGCDKTAIETLLKIESNKIVYVSCNPATLARDLALFEEKYEIKDLAICDMFPFTSHIESIAILKMK